MSLGADVQVPFLGKSVTVGFNFCTRERPFTLTVMFLGGGGWFGLRISPEGLDVLELGLEAGACLAVDLGVASGSISAMIGIYLRLEGDDGSLTGYFRLRGEVDVLGLISASIELYLELRLPVPTGKMHGRATITVEVKVLVFSGSVKISAERQFAGSNGDPTFLQIMGAEAGTSAAWTEYCLAFAESDHGLRDLLRRRPPSLLRVDADVHVSLFVAPSLSPTTPTVGSFGEFRLFPRWPDTLGAATPASGSSTRSTTSRPTRCSTRWTAPPGAPRLPPAYAGQGARHPGLVATASGAASPPAPSTTWARRCTWRRCTATRPRHRAPADHPLADDMRRITAESFRIAADRRETDERRWRRVFDERIGTEDLDNLVGSTVLAIIERAIAAEQDWMRRMLLELHRVRRFYERPESKGEYRERPIKGPRSLP